MEGKLGKREVRRNGTVKEGRREVWRGRAVKKRVVEVKKMK